MKKKKDLSKVHKTTYPGDTHKPAFTAVSFMTAEIWIQPECPTAYEWTHFLSPFKFHTELGVWGGRCVWFPPLNLQNLQIGNMGFTC